MLTSGINSKKVRMQNRAAVLRQISDRGAVSRKDIASALSLTRAAVTGICTELIAAGLLEEVKNEPTGRPGRQEIPISISRNCKRVLCVTLESHRTCVTLCDIRAKSLGSDSFDTDKQARPEEFLHTIYDRALKLLARMNVNQQDLLGVGVSVPGQVDAQSGASVLAYRVWDARVEVREILGRLFSVPVFVSNNVRAYAMGELLYGEGRDASDVFLIKWGPGVGSASIIAGEILSGEQGEISEIGHCIVDPQGDLCRCGRRGCLELRISTHALAASVRAALDKNTTPELYRKTREGLEINVGNVGEWLTCGDSAVREILAQAVDLLALAASNAFALLRPARVALYGYMFELEGVRESFVARVAHYAGERDASRIVASCVRESEPFIGPLAVVVDALFWTMT